MINYQATDCFGEDMTDITFLYEGTGPLYSAPFHGPRPSTTLRYDRAEDVFYEP